MQALLDAIAHTHLPTDAQRIFHGRGGLFPGCEHLTLDAFPPVWVLTSFQPLADDDLAAVQHALARRWGEWQATHHTDQPLCWVLARVCMCWRTHSRPSAMSRNSPWFCPVRMCTM